jgi:cytochrome c553
MPRRFAARRMKLVRRAFVSGALLACVAAGAGDAASAQSRIDPARGAVKAASCASCHGSPARAPLAGMPILEGQQEQYLVLQMILLREGLRDIPQMTVLLKPLPDQDLEDIAAHYSRLPPAPRGTQSDPERWARGARLSREMGCGSCHLKTYRGQNQVPSLANQREDYLAASLKAYRDNQRVGIDTNMNGLMYRVSDSDIQALAHYLAHQ